MRGRVRWVVTVMWVVLIGSSLSQVGVSVQDFTVQDFTVLLEGFQTQAKLTVPSGKTGPFATVLLLHAGYPSDMDASFLENGSVISKNFKLISDVLSAQGFAVARYNKRFVTSATLVDQVRYDRLRIKDFVADARAVLEVLRTNRTVDARRVFVLGWSEGALVATRLALEGADLRGLVLIGAPVLIQGQDSGLLEQAARLRLPVFVLQGLLDAITPPEQTKRLEAALVKTDLTLKYYPGLGHGLGPLAEPLNSEFAPTDRQPLEDLTVWLNRIGQ